VNGLKVEEMRVDQQYGCVRIKTTAELKGAKINVAIDIGFGDAIEPGLVDMDYPSCSIFRCLILRPMRVRPSSLRNSRPWSIVASQTAE
jgi:hypothetical protein